MKHIYKVKKLDSNEEIEAFDISSRKDKKIFINIYDTCELDEWLLKFCLEFNKQNNNYNINFDDRLRRALLKEIYNSIKYDNDFANLKYEELKQIKYFLENSLFNDYEYYYIYLIEN